ncbi:hypothetical protein BDV40DRAFT_277215 [Aspergillus tamarii]|uniref:Uncharacterized protein n=1 Tax=Aspergillus tamarii TaxID=41984 RepID=A0A5N6UH26_ASPTM|nr:hypothetical protein BDV40DRAFT_277215 [Aspergillus tamarii]
MEEGIRGKRRCSCSAYLVYGVTFEFIFTLIVYLLGSSETSQWNFETILDVSLGLMVVLSFRP